MVCKAPSESAIKGSVPTIKGLGSLTVSEEEGTAAERQQCQLDDTQVAAVRVAFADWNASAAATSCIFPTIEEILS